MNTSQMTVSADAREAARETGRVLAELLQDARDRRGEAHIALCGGNTPRAAYEDLAARLDDWSGIHVWLGDERVVPLDSSDANARLAAESLLRGHPLPDDRVHFVPTALGARGACEAYERELRRFVPADPATGIPRLDVAFLGLGEDAHTASLFPDSPLLQAEGDLCVVVEGAPKPPPVRISLSLPMLAAARTRVMLVTGAAKSAAVADAFGPPRPHVPASLLPREDTRWLLDRAAAAALPGLD